MTVEQFLTALDEVVRVDLTVGDDTYRVESNEYAILDSEVLALTIESIKLAVNGTIPYIIATTAE